MPANDFVRVRINPEIKSEAAAVLATMGLSVSDACRMMLTRIAYAKCLPFGADPFVTEYSEKPNELTRITMEKVDRGEELHRAKDAEDLFRQLDI